MKRSMLVVLALLAVGGVIALTGGCSKQTPTGVDPRPIRIESKVAFDRGGARRGWSFHPAPHVRGSVP
jgi:hypothetical protein